MRTFDLGAARIYLFDLGTLRFDVAESLDVQDRDVADAPVGDVPGAIGIPMQCVLLQTADCQILVDASVYDLTPASPFYMPGHQPPPPLPVQLAAAGFAPAQIDHVVITHMHFDHFNGVTQLDNGEYVPVFAHARHFVGQADWIQPSLRSAMRNPVSAEGRTLGVLQERGLVEPVDGVRALCAGIDILPAAGETPGHQIVRVHSQGETLYCIGDLYHHVVEVEWPAWTVQWADAEATESSRRNLVEAALAEDAYLIASHIPGVGRLANNNNGVQWVSV